MSPRPATQAQLNYIVHLRDRVWKTPARTTDVASSSEAINKVTDLTADQQLIYDLLISHGPLTDSEIEDHASRHGWKRAGRTYYRRRRSDLKRMGLAEPTNIRRKNPRGNTETAWVASNASTASNAVTNALTRDLRDLTVREATDIITTLINHLKGEQ